VRQLFKTKFLANFHNISFKFLIIHKADRTAICSFLYRGKPTARITWRFWWVISTWLGNKTLFIKHRWQSTCSASTGNMLARSICNSKIFPWNER